MREDETLSWVAWPLESHELVSDGSTSDPVQKPHSGLFSSKLRLLPQAHDLFSARCHLPTDSRSMPN